MQNLLEELKELLTTEPKYLIDGELLKNKIIEDALKLEPSLIKLLLKNDRIKSHFFTDIEGIKVFDKVKFQDFVSNKSFLPDSYTAFKNKIGLSSDNKFLKNSNDVVLNWAYKDCVLEGGMTKEETKSNVKEIFYNETLAPDEITRLLDEKVLTNFEYWDSEAVKNDNPKKPTKIDHEKDNLLIKGNNLLALHSLKRNYAGKVKLIYIDPPYNTGNDGFKYNDSFNHSSWLTFMKNRLEVARELLKDDGVIFISCDDNEYNYLKILMDEVYGEENFENIFHIKVRHENRILRKDTRYQKVIEQLLCYSKTNQYKPKRLFSQDEKEDAYVYNIKILDDKPKKVKIGSYDVEVYDMNQYSLEKSDSNSGSLKEYNIRGSLITQKGSASEFYENNLRERKNKDGLGALYKIINMGAKGDGLGYRYVRQPFDEKGQNGFYYQGRPLNIKEDIGNPYPNYYDFEKEFNNSSIEGGIKFANGKKPELFIQKIFELSNIKSGDIMLDFFSGSGSSIAVAHKSNIRWIAIEQMDYIKNLPEQRLKNVIAGDQTGVSKSVNWQGGGSFVYCELLEWNERFIQKVKNAKDQKELLEIYEDMKQQAFFRYDFETNKFDNKEFSDLEFEEGQKALIEILDKNHLYVNYSEIEDGEYKISDEDKKLTRSFYKDK